MFKEHKDYWITIAATILLMLAMIFLIWQISNNPSFLNVIRDFAVELTERTVYIFIKALQVV